MQSCLVDTDCTHFLFEDALETAKQWLKPCWLLIRYQADLVPIQFQGLQPVSYQEGWIISANSNQSPTNHQLTVVYLHQELTHIKYYLICVDLQNNSRFA